MISQERLDILKALYTPEAPNLVVDLIAEVERLQTERDEVKGRLSALIQACEAATPFIEPKFIVTEIKAAVELAKEEPIYQQKPEEWKEGRREE